MSAPVRLGIRNNLTQFTLLVVVNAFVGAMVGIERSILPAIAEHEFQLAARAAILSFIVVFGFTKAITNYFAGRFSDRWGCGGWASSLPVPGRTASDERSSSWVACGFRPSPSR